IQPAPVAGVVKDENDNPLSGVSITVKGSTRGVITDVDGSFSINVEPEDVLEISFVGYDTQQIVVGTQKVISIQLMPKANEFDEVTVVAFGTQKKESVVSSITTISPKELRVPSSNFTTAFSGRIAGMISYQTSGEPGYDNANFFIRGVTTFGTGKVDYAGIVDDRNIQLFPQNYSVEKWQRAAEALRAAIDIAHEAGHKLYDFSTTNPSHAAALNEKTILAMQVRGAATELWNDEIIWGDSKTNTLALQRACHPVFFVAQNGGGLYRTFAPTLQVVEQFYTKNGGPIEEDKEWIGVDPMSIRTATAADRYYIRENHRTIQLHFDREARFYGSVIFDGG